MSRTNAERQAAYRARRRAERNATVTSPIARDGDVTGAAPVQLPECARYYLWAPRGVPEVLAEIVSAPRCRPGRCPWCDRGREWDTQHIAGPPAPAEGGGA